MKDSTPGSPEPPPGSATQPWRAKRRRSTTASTPRVVELDIDAQELTSDYWHPAVLDSTHIARGAAGGPASTFDAAATAVKPTQAPPRAATPPPSSPPNSPAPSSPAAFAKRETAPRRIGSSSRPDLSHRTVVELVEAGTSAILDRRYDAALAAFTAILAIEPTHRTALANLQRLKSIRDKQR